MKAKTRIGIIGCGGIARATHIPNYKKIPSVEIVACADIKEDMAKKTAKEFEIKSYYTDYEELLEKETLDGVSVCTPNVLHKSPAISSMKHGFHVLVEKPMAGNLRDAREMYDASKKYNRMLLVGYQTRFSPDIVALKNILESHALGEVYYSRAIHLRKWGIPASPTFLDKALSGGGPLLDIGCYSIDSIMHILGYPKPKSVVGVTYTKFGKNREFARKGSWGGPWKVDNFGVEDNAFAFIRYADGSSMSFEVNWASFVKEDGMNLTFFGTKGGAQLRPLEMYKDIAGARVKITPQDEFPKVDIYEKRISAFVKFLRKGKALLCPAIEGLKDQAVLEAIYQSSELGREVPIEWDF